MRTHSKVVHLSRTARRAATSHARRHQTHADPGSRPCSHSSSECKSFAKILTPPHVLPSVVAGCRACGVTKAGRSTSRTQLPAVSGPSMPFDRRWRKQIRGALSLHVCRRDIESGCDNTLSQTNPQHARFWRSLLGVLCNNREQSRVHSLPLEAGGSGPSPTTNRFGRGSLPRRSPFKCSLRIKNAPAPRPGQYKQAPPTSSCRRNEIHQT